MGKKHLLISGAVAVLCGAILVLFTDIEVRTVRWFSCGPLSTSGEKSSEVCR
ncbi:hypothetical protein IFHNHDMJ_00955 [Synechococcus sp. CBW1107]|jgi:hypothetical protein|nr:hypothetical protein IFHNHDMJ_00955 [Synechococcus sp. CBW1107]